MRQLQHNAAAAGIHTYIHTYHALCAVAAPAASGFDIDKLLLTPGGNEFDTFSRYAGRQALEMTEGEAVRRFHLQLYGTVLCSTYASIQYTQYSTTTLCDV